MPLYSFLLLLALLLGSPFWAVRMLTSGRYRAGLRERLGFVPSTLAGLVGQRNVIWVHAVSVGEVLAAAELISGLRQARASYLVAISTTTEAGQRLAHARFPDLPVFFLPLDFAVLIRRYLRVLRPSMLILMESELWPNLLREAQRAGATVAVANARISDRSFPRYMRLRWFWRYLLRPVSLFLAQGEETASRLRSIGIAPERIAVAGNLKYEVRAAPQDHIYERLHALLPSQARLLVAGSTLEGEEELLLQAWPKVAEAVPGAALLLAPRHTNRFSAVAALIERRGFSPIRASQLQAVPDPVNQELLLRKQGVLLLDTIGDLAGIYNLAAAALVGGSLVAAAGHNPLEPARFGVPVVMGPSFENFREIVLLMQAEGAIRVLSAGEDLASALIEMLRRGDEFQLMSARATAVFASQSGATARSLEALLPLLQQKSAQ